MATKEAETETEPRKRGRPRPDDVINRDETVFAAITDEPRSIEDIVSATGLAKNLVYLSVFRLRRDERVTRVQSEDGTKTRTWVRSA